MEHLKAFWKWLKTNAPLLCLIAFLGIWVYANMYVVQADASNRKDVVACETLCFPQQSEYITKGESSSCWCYLDNNTIKRSE